VDVAAEQHEGQTGASRIRVLVADDHPVVRHGLVQILSFESDIDVVAQVGTGSAALECILDTELDVVVLDLSLPEMSGMEVLKRLREAAVPPPVLILTVHREDSYAIRTMQMGAAGYLTKASAAEELVSAVRMLADGRKYVSSTLSQHLALRLLMPHDEKMPHESLSRREFQVLCHLARGNTQAETAALMELSPKTVNTYRARILQKMRLSTTAQLIRYAVDHELIV
jgi:two-component system, NarL family, invasion response regulator UvrY